MAVANARHGTEKSLFSGQTEEDGAEHDNDSDCESTSSSFSSSDYSE